MLRCDWYRPFFKLFCIYILRHEACIHFSEHHFKHLHFVIFTRRPAAYQILEMARSFRFVTQHLRSASVTDILRHIRSMMASAHMLIHLVISLLTFCCYLSFFFFTSLKWPSLSFTWPKHLYLSWRVKSTILDNHPNRVLVSFSSHVSVKCFIIRTFHLDYDYIPSDLLYAKSQYDKCVWILRRISPTWVSFNSIHSFYIVYFIIIPGHKK